MEEFNERTFDFRLAGTLLRTRLRVIALCSFISLLLGLLTLVLIPQKYVATVTVLPVAESSGLVPSTMMRDLASGSFAGLASFVGSMSNADVYPDIIASRRFLGGALGATPSSGGRARSYREIFGFVGPDPVRSEELAVGWVRGELHVSANKSNGLITLSFPYKNAAIAASFLGALVDRLAQFNKDARLTQARTVRLFLEDRLGKARAELSEAENQMAAFRRGNIRFANSPSLAVEEGRLERNVRLAEGVFQVLTQQYEMSRIEEARDAPSFNVIDPPVAPRFPSGPGPLKRAALGAMAGFALACAWSVMPAWGGRR